MFKKISKLLSLALIGSVFGTVSPELKAEDSSDKVTLRVMTYNIQHGRGMDKKVDLERIAGVILKEKPDVVGLQEVDRGIERSGNQDLTEILAELTGMTGYFSNNFAFRGGEYGNAWLTRFPILEKDNYHFEHLHDGEPRGLLQILVEAKGEKLLLLNTHLSHRGVDAEDRAFSYEQAKKIISKHEGVPVVFIGDFNDTPGSELHKLMKKDFIDSWEKSGEGDELTFPSDEPNRRIDYIWLSRESGLSPVRTWVPNTLASDHRPVVTEIEWKR